MLLRVPGVPAGQYTATFSAIEKSKHVEYGEGLIWKFVIHGGQYDGQTAQRMTGPHPTLKNGCGKMLKGITGSVPSIGNEVELDMFIGSKFLILVEDADTGGTRIATVLPLRAEGGAA